MTTTEEKPVEQVMLPVDEPDPLWDMKYTGKRMAGKNRDIFYAAEGAECGITNMVGAETPNFVGKEGYWRCTRPAHPAHWRHIATTGHRAELTMMAMWGGTDPAELITEPGFADPDPGKFELEVGHLYKFRNRPTLLQFLARRGSDRVEVLDLTHEKYRVIAKSDVVPCPPDMAPPTPAQLRWLGTFMAERRATVRANAVKQRQRDYFKSRGDLDKILKELGLEPTYTQLSGKVSISIDVVGAGVSDSSAAKALMKEWAKSLPPLPDGLKAAAGSSFAVSATLSEKEQ